MKKILIAALILSCSAAFAQTTTTVTMKQMKGSDVIKMMPKITDSKIYDRQGNIVDSIKAHDMVRSFDYTLGMGKPEGQTEYKRMIFKVDHNTEGRFDADVKMRLRPQSPKLWEGVTLDLTPLANHADLSKLEGKAVVLLIRTRQYAEMYLRINEVIADNINSNKFEVFAITNLDYAAAKAAQKDAPILNAHHIVDAKDITDFYNVGNQTVVVITNTKHQITYAITAEAAMIPRIMNGLLKAL